MEKRSHRRIRDLVAHTAFQGLDANEIGCVRISMMARSKTAPEKGRIQMSETSYLQISHIRLATHGRSIQMCQSRAFAGYAIASEISPADFARPVLGSASALRLWAAQVTHIECFHRSAKAFKGEFACKF